MYLTKNIGRMNITLKNGHKSIFDVISISVCRFYGIKFYFCLLNITLIIRYVSEKQEKAFSDLCKNMNEHPEDW